MPVTKYLDHIKTKILIDSDAKLKSRIFVCNLYTKKMKKKTGFPVINHI